MIRPKLYSTSVKKDRSLPNGNEISTFETEAAEAEFWSTHDITEIWRHAKPVPPLKMSTAQIKAIRQRHRP